MTTRRAIVVLAAMLVIAAVLVIRWRVITDVRQITCEARLFFAVSELRGDYLANLTSPSRVLYDSRGRPIRGWRTLMALRYVAGFAAAYNVDESWDSESNITVLNHARNMFVCDNSGIVANKTNYAAIADGSFDSLASFDMDAAYAPDDEAAVILIEVPQSDINRYEPRDITPDEVKLLPESDDPGGIALALSNGHVIRLPREQVIARVESNILKIIDKRKLDVAGKKKRGILKY